jgi:hypothetical protein
MGKKRCLPPQHIDALKETLKETFGKDPMKSDDTLRIVNSDHLNCLERIFDEDKVFNRIAGEAKETRTNCGLSIS